MTTLQKIRQVCIRYNIYFEPEMPVDHFMLRKVMLKAYEFHKNIPFEEYVRSFMANSVEYIYNLTPNNDIWVELHCLNNCFKDGPEKKHFGVKYKNRWFFLSHSRNAYSLLVPLPDFSLKNKDKERSTFVVNYDNTNPNIVEYNTGRIRSSILDRYIQEFLV